MTDRSLIRTGGIKLPAVSTPRAPDKKAQLAARQDSFAQKVQALRAATGRIESRRVYFRCARTSGSFYADFERENPTERFRIARIEKEMPAGQGSGAAGSRGSVFGGNCSNSQTAFDHREFDTSGWYCPWCENGGHIFVHCTACGENVCKGRTTRRADGEELFFCHPGCGSSGTLTTTDKIHGTARPRPGLLPGALRRQPKALPGNSKSAPALPPPRPGNRLLGGPKR